jgi:hypothetical protein
MFRVRSNPAALILRNYGEDKSSREVPEAARQIEVQSTRLQSLQPVRSPARLHASLWYLPHLLSRHEPSRSRAGRYQKLVVRKSVAPVVSDMNGGKHQKVQLENYAN